MKKEMTEITKVRNERGDTTTTITEMKRIIRNYFDHHRPTN